MSLSRQLICSRYIAVLGFQRCEVPGSSRNLFSFPSAISRYLVSNKELKNADPRARYVSIRYIAVLGFQPPWSTQRNHFSSLVSIRYIAVLGFQQVALVAPVDEFKFPSAISRYLVPNVLHKPFELPACYLVSIRYIAVLGSQQKLKKRLCRTSLCVSIRYIAVLDFQRKQP